MIVQSASDSGTKASIHHSGITNEVRIIDPRAAEASTACSPYQPSTPAVTAPMALVKRVKA